MPHAPRPGSKKVPVCIFKRYIGRDSEPYSPSPEWVPLNGGESAITAVANAQEEKTTSLEKVNIMAQNTTDW